MRNVLISLAAAGAALTVATPAAAQYWPGQPYGYNDYGQVRALHARIDRIEQQINQLDRYNAIPGGAADRLRDQARRLEYRLGSEARNGLNPYEANDMQVRIGQLEQRVRYVTANRYGRYGYNRDNGDNSYGYYNQNGRWGGDGDEGDHDGN